MGALLSESQYISHIFLNLLKRVAAHYWVGLCSGKNMSVVKKKLSRAGRFGMGEGKELRWRDLPSVYERKHIGVYV